MPVARQRGKILPFFLPTAKKAESVGDSVTDSDRLSAIEAVGVAKPDFSIDPAFLIPVNALAGLFNKAADFMIEPPLNAPDAKPLVARVVKEKSFVMLPYGFLSIHLHIAMQSSIFHHPDLLLPF